jgi:hypothetical protein
VRIQGIVSPAVGAPLQPPGPTLGLTGLTILDNPGLGGDAAVARLAMRYFGDYYRPDGTPWSGWCEMFVGDVLSGLGIDHPTFPTALADAASAPLYRGRAPAGSLVFFDARISPYGHVGIALGDGTMISALGGGIVRTTYEDWPSYVGWRPSGTAASLTLAPTAGPARGPTTAPVPSRSSAGTSPTATPISHPAIQVQGVTTVATVSAPARGPKPASMAIGRAAIGAGILGLQGTSDGWMLVPSGISNGDTVAIGAGSGTDAAAPHAAVAPGAIRVTNDVAGAIPLGGPGPVGAVAGREGNGAAPGGSGRGFARWLHNRVLQMLVLGGGALLLMLLGLAMQRRQAVLAASGRRL